VFHRLAELFSTRGAARSPRSGDSIVFDKNLNGQTTSRNHEQWILSLFLFDTPHVSRVL
jgi:hypothetical protein